MYNDIQDKSTAISSLLDKHVKYLLIVLSLTVFFGIIMVYSSSYMYAKEIYGSSTYFFFRQISFMVIGVLIALVVSKTKVGFWLRGGHYINIFFTIVLFLTFIPGIGVSVNGASRWVWLGDFSLQPGEIIKYTLILSSLYLFQNFIKMDVRKRIIHVVFLILPLVFLILQPDYGSFLICFLVIAFVCFMSSFPRKLFYTFFCSGAILGIIILFMEPYRVKRLFAFLDPWKNPQTTGFQIIQSYLAFANGSIFGQGLGNSTEKLFYLPEAHNDFIFSVIGEELGLVGVTILIIAFLLFIFWGFRIACQLDDKNLLILVSSVIFVIGLQALLNMGVVLGLLPTKGLNLPFISYGGSSLVSNFFGIGLILSAILHTRRIRDAAIYFS